LVGRGAQGRWWRSDRPSSVCYDLDMAHRLELAAKGYDTEAARYVTRLLGIRQVVLGVMLWQARNDRVWLRRVATLNALTEALDAAATLASVGKQRDGRPSSAPAVAALATSAAFLALRAAAS
jgi:hypothetical protein